MGKKGAKTDLENTREPIAVGAWLLSWGGGGDQVSEAHQEAEAL